MRRSVSALDFLPTRRTLPSLREAAASCRGCELYRRATQTVFGQGRANATFMLVGEVRGDVEDREGQPFVGPAGRLLMTLLSEAGIDRRNVYVTNAVKHFSWTERGTRRLHKKPRWSEIQACKPWLQAEILAVTPRLIVALGAVAAQSLLGADFRITKNRGRIVTSDFDVPIVPTYHPSAVLRAPDGDRRDELRRDLLSDLVVAEQFVRLPALAGTSHER